MEENFGPIKHNVKEGNELFENTGNEKFKLLDFWKWSSSDLVSNSMRGILAEFIVGKSLGIDFSNDIRVEWDEYDLNYNYENRKIKIEVKSSAYIQTWAQKNYSKISFNIGKSKIYDFEKSKYSGGSKRRADIYVFCILKHKDQKTLNIFDMDQWVFCVVKTENLNDLLGDAKTISLNMLDKDLNVSWTHFRDLKKQVQEVMANNGE
jgi:hypothetical protein